MKTQVHRFTVIVPKVEGVPVVRWHGYIEDAVKSWGGQFEPVGGGYPGQSSEGDPLGPPCDWNRKVVVIQQRKRRKK